MTLLEILNLIITGLPSILIGKMYSWCCDCRVLNLIITGMPSIQEKMQERDDFIRDFKPYYNWTAFNTYWQNVQLVL